MIMGRYALIIASWEYKDRRLRRLVAPPQDAESLARVLQDPDIGGFEVEVLLNRPSYEVNRAIEVFFTDRKRDDLALLYFSGHGIKDGWGRLYFATPDTDYKTPRSTAVRASMVNEVMSDGRARCQVLLLDCCYSGAFGRAKAGASAGVQEQVGGKGRVVLTSSNALQYSFEGEEVKGEGVRSIFTRVLVRGLETGEADLDADGHISLDELYEYVYEQVTAEKEQQRPQMFATLEGKILVARNPHWTPQTAELPPELKQDIVSPLPWRRVGAVRELERLLHGSDAGLALAVRQALESMTEDDSRTVSTAATDILAAYARKRDARSDRAQEEAKQERLARDRAERERLAVQRAAAERAAREKAERERLARQKAKQERPAVRRAARARLAREIAIRIRGFITAVPRWAWIVVGTIAVVLLIAWGTVNLPFLPVATPTDTSTVTLAEEATFTPEPTFAFGDTITRPRDGMVMVYVPGGTFQMGSDEGNPDADGDEFPQHSVTLDDFWVDRTEVTNAQFAAFLNEQGNQTEGGVTWLDLESEYCPIEQVGGQYQPKSGYADHPVIEVSWYGADAYCQWAGAQLPTEAQWEYAARGEQGYIYPWGNDAPTCERAQFGDCPGQTVPVGTLLDGASWCGALDIAGNVWEWTADWYGAYSAGAQTNPTGPADGYSKVLRGGGWSCSQSDVRAANRNNNVPGGRYGFFGFRCVSVAPGR